MKKDSTTKFIGLDVHSKTISVAIADEGRINESKKPSVNCDFGKEAENHEKAQPCKRKNQATLFDFLEGSQGAK